MKELLLSGISGGAQVMERLLDEAARLVFPGLEIPTIIIKTSWREKQGAFSSGLSFLLAGRVGLSPAEIADRLRAALPDHPLFCRWEAADGHLNGYPSDLWYRQSAGELWERADFSRWEDTEAEFGFFQKASAAERPMLQGYVRLCSALRHARFEGLLPGPGEFDPAVLTHPAERGLLFSLCRLAAAREGGVFPALCETAEGFLALKNDPGLFDPRREIAAGRTGLLLICAGKMAGNLEKAGLFTKKSGNF